MERNGGKVTQGRKSDMLPYGNGCELFLDCFTYPLPDCVSIYGANRQAQERLVRLEKPFLERLKDEEVSDNIC